MGRFVPRVLNRLEWLEQAFINLLLLAMTLLVLSQVISRYVAALPAFWIEELARMTLVWLTFIGAALAVGHGTNLVVTFLSEKFGPGYTRGIKIASALLEIACFGVLIVGSWQLTERFADVLTSSSGLPRSLLFMAPLIGFALAVLHSIVNLVRELRGTAGHDEAGIEEMPI